MNLLEQIIAIFVAFGGLFDDRANCGAVIEDHDFCGDDFRLLEVPTYS